MELFEELGKYERDEVKPTIDVVKRLADVLETTAGYLLGESEDRELLKDPSMLKRLNDISKFPEADNLSSIINTKLTDCYSVFQI